MRTWMWAVWIFMGLFIGVGVYFMAKYAIRRYTERRILNYQNDLLARHYDEVLNIYQKMRGWRHDYHNHIQTLKAYREMNQLDELDTYLNQLETDLTTVDTVLKTGNIKLDAILNSKLSLVTEKIIRINATAQVPPTLTISEVDLYVIVGNLLDNAMEACERVVEPDERFIRVFYRRFEAASVYLRHQCRS